MILYSIFTSSQQSGLLVFISFRHLSSQSVLYQSQLLFISSLSSLTGDAEDAQRSFPLYNIQNSKNQERVAKHTTQSSRTRALQLITFKLGKKPQNLFPLNVPAVIRVDSSPERRRGCAPSFPGPSELTLFKQPTQITQSPAHRLQLRHTQRKHTSTALRNDLTWPLS